MPKNNSEQRKIARRKIALQCLERRMEMLQIYGFHLPDYNGIFRRMNDEASTLRKRIGNLTN